LGEKVAVDDEEVVQDIDSLGPGKQLAVDDGEAVQDIGSLRPEKYVAVVGEEVVQDICSLRPGNEMEVVGDGKVVQIQNRIRPVLSPFQMPERIKQVSPLPLATGPIPRLHQRELWPQGTLFQSVPMYHFPAGGFAIYPDSLLRHS
jgi:hypothetical protein